ncbi:MAG: hypothetical protein ACTHXO_13440, partial [Actinomycetaceae bacterium]
MSTEPGDRDDEGRGTPPKDEAVADDDDARPKHEVRPQDDGPGEDQPPADPATAPADGGPRPDGGVR